jgi:hypothetical protein
VRRLVAVLALFWALANIGMSFFFVMGAFTSKTAAKEGVLAQLSLLGGGVLIAALGLLLAWQCFRVLTSSGGAGADSP